MIEQVLVALVILVLLAWVVSPLESLVWWAQTGARAPGRLVASPSPRLLTPASEASSSGSHTTWLVHVTGVGATSPDVLAAAEQRLLDGIEAGTQVHVVTGIYPYAVDNRSLTQGRRSSAWWRFLSWAQSRPVISGLFLVTNIRNVFQMLVSADRRYGPIYSSGVAATMLQRLREAGYSESSGDPIIVLGWSGGAQVAIGAAWFLAQTGSPLHVVTLGGVFSDDPGLDRIAHISCLTGSRDPIPWIGPIVFPGRRRVARRSSWRRAVQEGRVTQRDIGPLKHVGSGSYLSRKAIGGTTCLQLTIDAICAEVNADKVAHH